MAKNVIPNFCGEPCRWGFITPNYKYSLLASIAYCFDFEYSLDLPYDIHNGSLRCKVADVGVTVGIILSGTSVLDAV